MEHKRINEILEEAKRVARTSYEEAYAFLLEEMEGIPWLIHKEKTDSKKELLEKLSNDFQPDVRTDVILPSNLEEWIQENSHK